MLDRVAFRSFVLNMNCSLSYRLAAHYFFIKTGSLFIDEMAQILIGKKVLCGNHKNVAFLLALCYNKNKRASDATIN